MNEELKVIISAQIDKLKSNVDKAKKEVKSFQEQVKEASSKVDDNFKAIGEASSKALTSIATGIAGATTALVATSAATEEYRNNQAKLTTAFETAGASAEQAKETYNDLYRVLGDGGQATEAASHLAKLTTEEQALSEWTTICQGVYATFGDSLPIESLTEAANETAKTGELTGSLADALNWAGISEDSFSESLANCNSEAEREQLIRETLNGLYSEAASSYEETNASILAQNEAQAELQSNLAAVGEAMTPVLTAFTSFGSDALAVVIPYVEQLAQDLLPVLQSILEGVASALEVALTWALEHQTLLGTIAGVITGLVTAIGLYNAVAAVKAAMDAAQVTTLAGLATAYIAQAAAMAVAIAPYALIVAAIAAVIAIIVTCVKHWDEIKAKVKEVWDSIKNWTEQAVSKVTSKFNEMKSKTDGSVRAILDFVGTYFSSIKNVIESNIQTALTICQNVLSLIKSAFKGDLEGVKQSAANILNALLDNFRTKLNSIKDVVKSGLNAVKSFFDSAKWELPKIKLPHLSISGSFSINPPSVPSFSIEWYKMGGVFDTATLFGYGSGSIGGLGEDGAEAIVPLEKNTKWLDRLASMLVEKTGGNTPVVLEVDGKVFAQTAISTINKQTRQTGKLALNLV